MPAIQPKIAMTSTIQTSDAFEWPKTQLIRTWRVFAITSATITTSATTSSAAELYSWT